MNMHSKGGIYSSVVQMFLQHVMHLQPNSCLNNSANLRPLSANFSFILSMKLFSLSTSTRSTAEALSSEYGVLAMQVYSPMIPCTSIIEVKLVRTFKVPVSRTSQGPFMCWMRSPLYSQVYSGGVLGSLSALQVKMTFPFAESMILDSGGCVMMVFSGRERS